MTAYQLAQVNIAVLRAPIDSAQLADFVANLDPVNALAESAPGFIWRPRASCDHAAAARVVRADEDGLHGFVVGAGGAAALRA